MEPIEVQGEIISPGDIWAGLASPRVSRCFFSNFNPATRIQVDERRGKAIWALDFPDCRRTSLVLAGKPRKRVVTLSWRIKYFCSGCNVLAPEVSAVFFEILYRAVYMRVANQKRHIPSVIETLYSICSHLLHFTTFDTLSWI